MKIIFLDIDGVLNSKKWFLSPEQAEKESYIEKSFDPKAVELLNTILKETSAKIVVSSSWRLWMSVEELAELLNGRWVIGEIIWKTPNLRSKGKEVKRGEEIEYWLNNNDLEIKEYIIIDDDSDMLSSQKNNFIHTSFETWLTKQSVTKSIKILNNKLVSSPKLNNL